MKFSYLKFPLSEKSEFLGGSILKPIIPLKISYNGNSISYMALIDSGADFCIFDAEIGENLGLDVKLGERIEFGGIQSIKGADAFLHKITVNIGGWDYSTKVGFSYGIAPYGFGVLGQRGFFDIFIVKFDLQKEEIELKERTKKK